MDFKLSPCKNIIILKQTYIVNMLLMAMAAGTGLLLYKFFKLSEGLLSNVCLGMGMCICERFLACAALYRPVLKPLILLIFDSTVTLCGSLYCNLCVQVQISHPKRLRYVVVFHYLFFPCAGCCDALSSL